MLIMFTFKLIVTNFMIILLSFDMELQANFFGFL